LQPVSTNPWSNWPATRHQSPRPLSSCLSCFPHNSPHMKKPCAPLLERARQAAMQQSSLHHCFHFRSGHRQKRTRCNKRRSRRGAAVPALKRALALKSILRQTVFASHEISDSPFMHTTDLLLSCRMHHMLLRQKIILLRKGILCITCFYDSRKILCRRSKSLLS
jgi:hypothetical protein